MSKQLSVIQKQSTNISQEVEALVVDNEKSLEVASTYRSNAKKYLKDLTTEKEKVTKPLNEALKAERARFKPIEESLEAIIETLDDKMSEYQTALVKAQEEAQKKLIARVERGTMKEDTAMAKIEEMGEVGKKVGQTSFVATKMFEVVSLEELPIAYHVADEIAIRKEMNAGRQLPGVKYWTEQRPRNI